MDLMKTARRLAFGAVLLPVSLGAAFAIAPVSASAAPQTTTTTTRVAIPAAQCAAINAALSRAAANPADCTATHVEQSTTVAGRRAPAVAAACFVGSRSFSDSFVDGAFWGVQLNSTFTWTGCSNPTVRITTCRENFTAFGYTLTGIHCSNYTTGIPSRAALLEGYAHLPQNIANYYFYVRRECYSGGPGTCNFNWG